MMKINQSVLQKVDFLIKSIVDLVHVCKAMQTCTFHPKISFSKYLITFSVFIRKKLDFKEYCGSVV